MKQGTYPSKYNRKWEDDLVMFQHCLTLINMTYCCGKSWLEREWHSARSGYRKSSKVVLISYPGAFRSSPQPFTLMQGTGIDGLSTTSGSWTKSQFQRFISGVSGIY